MRSILVPLDGSTFSEKAIPVALAVARRAKASITLLRAYEPPRPLVGSEMTPFVVMPREAPTSPLYQSLAEEIRRAHENYLRTTVSRIGSVPV